MLCAALAGLVLLAFGQSVRYGFLNWDDIIYIRDCPEVSAGLSWKGFAWAWTHPHYSNWHPLTTLSFMLDSTLFQKEAGGFHAHNILLHIIAALFFFFALRSMTGARWKSAAAAAVFAIHPLRVESVVWVTERKDVLSGLFLMATLWAYAHYVKQPSRWRMALVCLLHAFGLLSKSMLVTFPALLLTLDFWPLRRHAGQAPLAGVPDQNTAAAPSTHATLSWQSLLIEKLPLIVLSAVSCAATILSTEDQRPLTPPPFLARMEYVPIWLLTYLRMFLFPVNLAAHYPYSQTGPAVATAVQALVLVGVISYACIVFRKTLPMLLMGWSWFVIALLPVIGIIPPGIQIIADRYTYVPQVGFSICAIWLLARVFNSPQFRWIGAAVAVVWILALTGASHLQTHHWRSDEALWRHAVDVTTDNDFANGQLGDCCAVQGKLAEAEPFYREALRINPQIPGVLSNLGVVLRSLGRPMDAEPYLRKAIEVSPWFVTPRLDLAGILLSQNKYSEAIEQLRLILETEPDNFTATFTLGKLLSDGAENCRDLPSAVRLLARARELNPNSAEAMDGLAAALCQSKAYRKAAEVLRDAITKRPSDLRPVYKLAWLFATTEDDSVRDPIESRRLANYAIEHGANNQPMMYDVLAAAYAAEGEFERAIEFTDIALDICKTIPNASDEVRSAIERHAEAFRESKPWRE